MRLSIIAILLFGILWGAIHLIVHSIGLPYLYYYSSEDNAFVIERVDGSDRHLLAQGLAENRAILGMKWSPSGRWLAWGNTSYESNGELINVFDIRGWVSSYDGEVNIPISETWGWGSTWEWSPTEDLLLVSNYRGYGSPSFAYIVDVETQEVHLSLNKLQLTSGIYWSDDGQFIWYLQRDSGGYNPNTSNSTLFMVDLNGKVTKRPHSGGIAFGPDHQLIYLHPQRQTLMLENLETGHVWEIPQLLHPPISKVIWSPDGESALIYAYPHTFPNTRQRHLALWLLTDRGLELVTKNAVPFDESSEWAHNPTSNWFHWTPQSDRAIFATMDGHVYWLYTDPFRIDALNLPTERDLTEYGQRYTIQGPVGVQWMPNGRTGFVMWGGMVWEYDLSTNTLSDAPTDYDISMVISPSGAFIAQIESCDPAADYDRQHRRIQPYTNCIFDLVRQERTAVFSAKSSYVEYNLGGLVRWHPDGEWAILMEEMGTRYASLGSSVVHRFGFHIARFNQSAHGRNINAYWLPENVPID